MAHEKTLSPPQIFDVKWLSNDVNNKQLIVFLIKLNLIS